MKDKLDASPVHADVRPLVDEEEFIFRSLARAHPHEVYATHPDRFWNFFQEECPCVSRVQMEALLRESEAA